MTRLDLEIASPCSADWSAMQGDAKRRFCSQCQLHVHDLSAMTRPEAEAILEAAGQGRVCVRFYRRLDGTVLTQDCPVGLRQRLRRAKARLATAAAGLLSGLLSLAGCTRDEKKPPRETPRAAPVEPQPVVQGEVYVPERHEMGDVAVPPLMGKPRAPSPGGSGEDGR